MLIRETDTTIIRYLLEAMTFREDQRGLEGDLIAAHFGGDDFLGVLEDDEEHGEGDDREEDGHHGVALAGQDLGAAGELGQQQGRAEADDQNTDLHADAAGGVELGAVVIVGGHDGGHGAVGDVHQGVEHAGSDVSKGGPQDTGGAVAEGGSEGQDAEDGQERRAVQDVGSEATVLGSGPLADGTHHWVVHGVPYFCDQHDR